MVIILQQRLEDGHRFVSTLIDGTRRDESNPAEGVCDGEEAPSSSFHSSSSNNPQQSISERSAVYKQRIDSLFGRPRLISFTPFNPKQGVISSSSSSSSSPSSVSSSEDVPSSVVTDSLNNGNRPWTSSVRITSPVKAKSIMWRNNDSQPQAQSLGFMRNPSTLQFPVEYLGSVPVDGTTTSLQDLQGPLRKLYMDFLTGTNVVIGMLGITSDGIRFEAPKLRLVNPFSTIAVWAAIKFVAKGMDPMECAFMPLISDPEGQDKGRLFSPMEPNLFHVYTRINLPGGETAFRNPPLFACVMREASYSLDCHAFACKCAEDAIVIAANLYQSLVDKMRLGKEGESGYGSLASPGHHRSSSSASASSIPKGFHDETPKDDNNDTSSCPPQIREGDDKGGTRGTLSDSESIVPTRPPRAKNKSTRNLKRYNSEDSVLLKIPQGGKRQCYPTFFPPPMTTTTTTTPGGIKAKKRVQITTPADERSSSSTTTTTESIDQVLDRIINPGGMSFNDLRPSYQDLILKIALTLTQDQLYKKSKQAMKKQQMYMRKRQRKGLSISIPSTSSGGDSPFFLHHLIKSFAKIKKKPTTIPLPPQSPRKVILKKRGREGVGDPPPLDTQFMSLCSGCICEHCSDKCYCSLPSHKNGGITGPNKKPCGYDSESCAESEKCYCSLQRVKANGLKIYNINLDTETSDTDTNSYDLEPFNNKMEQQPQSSSSSNGKTLSATSIEMLSYHPSKRVFSPDKAITSTTAATVHCQESNNRDKVLLITGSNPSGKLVYKDIPSGPITTTSIMDKSSQRRNLIDIMEDENGIEEEEEEEGPRGMGPEKVLSMKKTAEIAAMFTELKLDQTTNLVQQGQGSTTTQPNYEDFPDFETSLGYLP